MIPMIIDTDTASDDAVALVVALTDPRVEVLAITVVSGNVPMVMGVQNALYTVQLCGAGRPRPRWRGPPLGARARTSRTMCTVRTAWATSGCRLRAGSPRRATAWTCSSTWRGSAQGELTLVTLGPLTNLALALRKAPGIAGLYKRVVMMIGAADGLGNVTPAAEFNVHVDPEAAD